MQNQKTPSYTLRQLVLYYFKLGYAGFGGPVALVGYMHRDLVDQRKWIAEEEYKEGLALAQLSPGPLAAQLGIYIGFVHYGVLGATLCGLAFIVPSFIMVVLIGMAYKLYGGLPWMQAVFYGIGAAVVGIIALSYGKLTTKSVSILQFQAIKQKWLLWILYFIALAITLITQAENVIFFLLAGIIYWLVKSPPKWIKNRLSMNAFILSGFGFWQFQWSTLGKIAWFFAKAGAFVFGSGLAIVPFLHGGVVKEYHWLTERQFVDAIAVAMITPGPVVITVGFIGYLVGGFPGACIAALATFLPCYLFTIIPAFYFKKIAKNTSVKAFVDGITAAVIGALGGAVILIALRTITDSATAIIAIASLIVLLTIKKVKEQYIIIASAIIGLIIKTLT